MNQGYARVYERFAELEIVFKYECLSFTIDSINICPFSPGGGYDFHMHSNYEFHYIRDGNGIVVLHGIEYKLGPGDFYITGPGVLHKQVADNKNPMLEYALSCDILLCSNERDISKYILEEQSNILDTLQNKTSAVVNDQNQLDVLFEKLFEEVGDKKIGFYSHIKNLIMQIMIASSRNFNKGETVSYMIPKRDINDHRMKLIQSYVQDNFGKHITCKEIADQLFLSCRQVNRIVRGKTGYSVHDFILQQKIQKAKDVLKNTELKLSEISEQMGFSSEFHLSNVFKKRAGISPSGYRELGKNKLNQEK